MKTVVILSSEPWGKMMLSKMHFAHELSEQGYKVFFVDPPRKQNGKNVCDAIPLTGEKSLTVINVKENPLRVVAREKFNPLYKQLEKHFVSKILEITGPIDTLWNFNPHFITDSRLFQARKNLLFLYDRYSGKNIARAADQADAIISVAQNILDTVTDIGKPKLLINHGLASDFETIAKEPTLLINSGTRIKIGYVGNLLRSAIDHTAFKSIIQEHPEIEFHIWGPSGMDENNVSGSEIPMRVKKFTDFLAGSQNVKLHGVKVPYELAREIQNVDGFLFLYDRQKDMNHASNSHKLIEYLSTGKPVFSLFVSSYKNSNLLVMQNESDSTDFPTFFSREVKKISQHSTPEIYSKRINFALGNTYKNQILRIQQFINSF